jgi:branched-chain amino acid aminotransferase
VVVCALFYCWLSGFFEVMAFLYHVCSFMVMDNTLSMLNRAFIYGDLLFETIKVEHGKPLLARLHYNRLISSARLLRFDTGLTFETFIQQIEHHTAGQNRARVRFLLHRNAGGFYTPEHNGTGFLIEVFPLPETRKERLRIGLYTDQYKPCHELSNLKSGNALVYVMAGIWAKENGFDDAVILNEHGCVCEATSSNIFIVKDEKVYTPALTEGCVDGVMRAHVIAELKQNDYVIHETVLTVEQLEQADAVFLTSAIAGTVGVSAFGSRSYSSPDRQLIS